MMLLEAIMSGIGGQSSIIAQSVNGDLWINIQGLWSNLVETGQLWALLIGVGLGWWVRSLLP